MDSHPTPDQKHSDGKTAVHYRGLLDISSLPTNMPLAALQLRNLLHSHQHAHQAVDPGLLPAILPFYRLPQASDGDTRHQCHHCGLRYFIYNDDHLPMHSYKLLLERV